MIISMPLSELKLYYLATCNDSDLHLMMYGSLEYFVPEVPSLTGWIKYWKSYRENNVYYPKLGKILRYDSKTKQYIEIRLVYKDNVL